MIIDIHGHYTTEPPALHAFRDKQLAGLADPSRKPSRQDLGISDEALVASVQPQLKFQKERGGDLTIFSPRAGGMAHHVGTEATGSEWSRMCNDLIHRICTLLPDNFAPVGQLPQFPGVSPKNCIPELERIVKLGFVGVNLNPDPAGGYWTDPPLIDRYWYPLYEKLCELDVPAMIHVSSSCNPTFHHTGAHYINGDTTAFMQLIQGDLFKDFPTLQLRDSARRRRGAVPLGALPRPRAGHGEAAAHRAPAEERVLRHLRLSPARHRAAGQGDPGRQHPVRLRDGRRGEGHRPRDRAPLRRHQAVCRPAELAPEEDRTRSSKATRGASIRGWIAIKDESSHRDGRSRRHRPRDRRQGGARQAGARDVRAGGRRRPATCSKPIRIAEEIRLVETAAREFHVGEIHPEHGLAALDAARTAIRGAMSGDYAAVVAAPHSETAIHAAGIEFDGYPSFVARTAGLAPDDGILMLCFEHAGREVRIAHVTLHASVRDALEMITTERVLRTIRAVDTALKKMGIEKPKIAVSGVNPHAGEGGLFGDEEQKIVTPAIEAARAQGHHGRRADRRGHPDPARGLRRLRRDAARPGACRGQAARAAARGGPDDRHAGAVFLGGARRGVRHRGQNRANPAAMVEAITRLVAHRRRTATTNPPNSTTCLFQRGRSRARRLDPAGARSPQLLVA